MDQDNQQLNNTPVEGVEIPSETTPQKRKSNKIWDIVVWILIAALSVAVLVRAFVVSKVTVKGESMADTYHNNDKITVNKVVKPQRGDVVVFYKNPVKSKFLGLFASGDKVEEDGEYYKLIKRVVALGGDKLYLESIGGGKYRLVVLTPQGEVLHEDYYQKGDETLSEERFVLSVSDYGGLGRLADCTEDNPLVIEEGYFFAIGDNRTNSADSRGELGPVPLKQLFGVVI